MGRRSAAGVPRLRRHHDHRRRQSMHAGNSSPRQPCRRIDPLACCGRHRKGGGELQASGFKAHARRVSGRGRNGTRNETWWPPARSGAVGRAPAQAQLAPLQQWVSRERRTAERRGQAHARSTIRVGRLNGRVAWRHLHLLAVRPCCFQATVGVSVLLVTFPLDLTAMWRATGGARAALSAAWRHLHVRAVLSSEHRRRRCAARGHRCHHQLQAAARASVVCLLYSVTDGTRFVGGSLSFPVLPAKCPGRRR